MRILDLRNNLIGCKKLIWNEKFKVRFWRIFDKNNANANFKAYTNATKIEVEIHCVSWVHVVLLCANLLFPSSSSLFVIVLLFTKLAAAAAAT